MKSKFSLFIILLFIFIACQKNEKQTTFKINWTEVESIPASFGKISKGVSAAFVGLIDDKLVVAGGCNFPDISAAEGGKKVFYNEILMLNGSKWEKIGELPYELAYGVSVNLQDTLLFIGGRNNDFFSAAVYRIWLDHGTGKAMIDSLTPLSVSIDNASGSMLDNIIYIMGGIQDNRPTSEMYSLDLKKPIQWEKRPSIPSRSLIQSVMVAQKGALYVFGGYDVRSVILSRKNEFRKDTTLLAKVSQTVWKFSPDENKWTKVSDYPSDGEFSSLSGGVGAALCDSLILTVGGVNKLIFEEALNRNLYLSKNTDNQLDTLTSRMRSEAKSYMLHSAEWYKFNSDLILFNTVKNTWIHSGQFSQAALAGSSVVSNDKEIYIVNGELKPGVRTPKIWKITW